MKGCMSWSGERGKRGRTYLLTATTPAPIPPPVSLECVGWVDEDLLWSPTQIVCEGGGGKCPPKCKCLELSTLLRSFFPLAEGLSPS